MDQSEKANRCVDRARIYAKESVDQLFGLAAPDVER